MQSDALHPAARRVVPWSRPRTSCCVRLAAAAAVVPARPCSRYMIRSELRSGAVT